ncbi:MAG TPA: BON domain-containing protein [Pyrinomonadaceae bacterium]|nr:BON domain-containing protein [Pyrinomonadaceae bacterium]
MNKGLAVVSGVGLGAALMYIFDPDRGKRRRALLRDKVEAAANKVGDTAGKMGRDLRNRASGVVAETKAIFSSEEVPDDVLVDRVRARLGRLPVHIEAFEVSAHDGVVTLGGKILTDELPRVLRAARFVRGVKGVDNQFEVHTEPGNASALQSEPQPLGAQ